jgi:two-component system, cell cycle response regulator DivK
MRDLACTERQTTGAAAPLRIVLIEDTPELLELLSIILSSGGHKVFKACNGLEGLALARSELPDLIIADVEMPGMDGFEVLRRARGDARLAQRPIIALTACAMRGDRERLLTAGFTGYVAKPVRPRELLPLIEAYARA